MYLHEGCRCEQCCQAAADYTRKWRADNPESVRASVAKVGKEKYNEYHARYREKNREALRDYHRQWRLDNPQSRRDHVRRYWLANREVARESERRYRARKAAATVLGFTIEQLSARWDYYGGKCWMCGGEATTTDHVKPLAKGGAHMLCNLRPACKPCNSGKRATWPLPRLQSKKKPDALR